MIITDLDKLRRINMNKKEINEIKRIFSDDGIGIKMDGVANG